MERLTIHEMIKNALHAEDVELINVPVEGSPIALLRIKHMPEYAFVMWVSEKTSTYSQMVFCLPDHGYSDRYPVVCACCRSEQYGITPPEGKILSLVGEDDWQKGCAQAFKNALVETALANGITTLFMRRAKAWSRHYGNVHGLDIVEASEFEKAMTELYGCKLIREAMRFIDFHASRGLSE